LAAGTELDVGLARDPVVIGEVPVPVDKLELPDEVEVLKEVLEFEEAEVRDFCPKLKLAHAMRVLLA
jgi:hypothetical protein